ncbi:cytochrome d ubiquinol oxidase subunit II [Pelotomaculum terephthalicicum JT]|uniref:cytochrome d ubiquinol oxidase subunit II n=1 Tax=Pelotomaculum TaxID=191373 RepID=UPI0009D003A5|nr:MULTISPECIES: cytochrome d ubiquinol oxidase subunit II [Pelotomaculum]MCG9968486.1 cytochrome d ubiquinol oxidase subunit II [Pelotomaculum terephthalicicum JT]OPX88909.1 MAG: Cytochrome bd-I ubiquinol oxidase subunit 2 [Pelotomaculum sp. PtaB.Bin117]
MELQILWFGLWGLLWAVYFMLDGFDLGVGILAPFIGKSEMEKRILINTVGPVWDGNEVWLLAAGGVMFAAFPTAYAYMFSYLYAPLLLILFALIGRGVSFEFRGKVDSDSWRKTWDMALFLGSLVPALLFGVAFGNIFQGLPMDARGYHGNLLTLLNPYGLLTGLLFLLLFLEHAAIWITVKTEGALEARARALAAKLWWLLLLAAAGFLVLTAFATKLYTNFMSSPAWLAVPAAAVLALLCMKILISGKKAVAAFFSSCVTIVMVTFTGIIGLFPNLIPSSLDPRYSLTAFNSSASPYTLKIMTLVVAIFIPIVIAYQIWAYIIFKDPVTEKDLYDPDSGAY